MSSEAPQWLDARFLEEALRGAEDDSEVRVLRSEVEPAVAKGENYLSSLFRAAVKLRRGDQLASVSLIVKSPPAGEVMQMMCSELSAFHKEKLMYEETLPWMQRLIGALSARLYPSYRKDTLVLEDLSAKGFVVVPRQSQLDLQHCLKAMEFLARFHAATIILHKENPSSIERYKENLFVNEKCEIAKYVLEPTLKVLAYEVKKWPGFERFASKIRNMSSTGVKSMIEMLKPDKNSVSVLNHGDFWINNIMYKYREGTQEIEEVRCIDFQISKFCSPVIDLLYFMNSSPQEEVRLRHTDQLIGRYHTTLCATLAELGVAECPVSVEQVQREIEEKALYGAIIASTILCNVLAEPDSAPDFSALTISTLLNTQGVNPMQRAFAGQLFRKQFQNLLLTFEKNGVM